MAFSHIASLILLLSFKLAIVDSIYPAKLELKTGGNFGYTFRVMPKHDMLLDPANLNLVKWITE